MSKNQRQLPTITNLHPHDVIIGRGQGPRAHGGNQFYHSLVRKYKAEYSSTRCREQKTEIARRIIHAIAELDPPGRFLRPVPPRVARKHGIDPRSTPTVQLMFFVLDDVAVLKKTKQTLRDAPKQPETSAAADDAAAEGAAQKQYTLEEEEAADALFSLLTFEDAPKFTQEQLDHLKEEVPDEERQAALADMFGDMCEVTPPPRKRTKRPTQCYSLEYLLQAMGQEIKIIPARKKKAFTEALAKAAPSEFSQERMEMFLRREEFDVKRAAQRVVRYWEERHKLFGPEKFWLPMTLQGALRDDHVALEAGLGQLLPGLDDSGRQIMWIPLKNHTREGYDAKSMVRAFWYLYEVAMEHPNAAKGIIQIGDAKGCSLWEYDLMFHEGQNYLRHLDQVAFPLTLCATHCICLPKLYRRLVVPVFLAPYSRGDRLRVTIHHVPDGQALKALSSYGVREEVVPTHVGGKCVLNQHEWLEKRRIAEGAV